jgi:hypothetical protein
MLCISPWNFADINEGRMQKRFFAGAKQRKRKRSDVTLDQP